MLVIALAGEEELMSLKGILANREIPESDAIVQQAVFDMLRSNQSRWDAFESSESHHLQ